MPGKHKNPAAEISVSGRNGAARSGLDDLLPVAWARSVGVGSSVGCSRIRGAGRLHELQ